MNWGEEGVEVSRAEAGEKVEGRAVRRCTRYARFFFKKNLCGFFFLIRDVGFWIAGWNFGSQEVGDGRMSGRPRW